MTIAQNKLFQPDGAPALGKQPVKEAEFITIVPTGDDAGVIFDSSLRNVVIGSKENPAELVVGSGDSTTDTMAALQSSDEITYTDVTAIFASDSASTAGLFGGTAAGNAIYLGFDTQYSNTKVKVNTAGVIDPDNIVSEFWNGAGWTSLNFMAVNSTFNPFSDENQRASNIASVSGISEQWHFDFDPYVLTPEWQQSTIDGTLKYWARLRIVTNITTDAIIEQVKVGPSRVEIESTGVFRAGLARYPKILVNGLSNTVQNTTQNPLNQAVSYSPTITAGYTDNQFANGADDGFLFVQNIEVGTDTSILYALTVAYYVEGVGTGQIELEADVVQVGQEVNAGQPFTYDGTAPVTTYSVLDNLLISDEENRRTATFYIDISDLTPKDSIIINVHRDATAGNPDDTHPDNVIITHIVPIAYFWKD